MNLLLLPLTILLLISHVQSYTFSGYGIKDLEGTDTTTFQAEADSWTLSANVSTAKVTTTTTTTPVPILGGLSILGASLGSTNGQYFQRVYSGLPPHTFAGFTVVMWFFDSAWDTLAPVYFKFDTTSAYMTAVSYSSDFTSYDGGIAAQRDLGFDHIKGAVAHSGSTLTFQIISQGTATSATQSFGFRELNIHFSNYTTLPAVCHISEEVATLSTSQCDCSLNQGKDASSVCQSCASGCSICFGSLATQCLACSSSTHWDGSSCNTCATACKTCTGSTYKACTQCSYGAYDYGNNTCSYSCPSPFVAGTTMDSNGVYTCSKPCTSTQWYWAANSSCLNQCNSPLEQSTDADGIVYCTNPCTNVNYYLYDNKSCYASCTSPLVAKFYTGVRFCSNPCDYTTQYLYTNRSCFSTCPTPLVSRSEPYVKYCFNPCTISSYYLYNNGSCYASCNSPLIARSESGVKYCYTPCSSVNEYIFANGSCSTTCPSPLVSRTEINVANYCDNPCSTSYYVLQNSSCSASCPSPLVSRSEPNVKYCYNPCSDPTNYLYTNGTCKATCPSPLMSRSEPNVKYCWNPCAASSQYLYSDQSCHSSCSSPLKILKNPGVNYCYTPCSQVLYVNDDGTCTSTCEYPYKIVQNPVYKVCSIDLNTVETQQAETLAQAADAANIASFLGGLLTNIFTPGDPTSMLMWSMIKMIEFVKYTKVSFPAQMEQIFATQNDYYIKEGFMTSTGSRRVLTAAFSDDNKLGKFGYYAIPTKFIDNFWQQLIVLTILFFGALFTLAMSFGKTRSPKAQNRLQKAMEILKWNAILVVFCGTYGDLVLYSALEFQTISLVNFISVFSFLICLAMVFLAVLVPIKVILVNRALMKSKNTAIVADSTSTTTVVYQSKEAEKKWQNYKVFFEVYKSESYSQQLFLLIYLLRVALFNIIIGYLYNAPLAQALLIFFLNAAMTIYLYVQKPIKKRLSHIQQCTIEVMLLVYNFCLLLLAIFDKTGTDAEGARAAFGGIMVVIILVGPLTVALIILFKLGLHIKEAYLRYKRKPNKEEFLQLNPRSVTGASVEGMQIRPARRVRGVNEVNSNLEMSEMAHAIPNNRTFVEADSSIHMPHNNTRRLDSIMNQSNMDMGVSQTERSVVEMHLRRSEVSLASNDDHNEQNYHGRNLRLEENPSQIQQHNNSSHNVQRFNNASNSITRTATQELSFTNNGVYNAHAALGIRLKRRLYNMSGTQLDTTNPPQKN